MQLLNGIVRDLRDQSGFLVVGTIIHCASCMLMMLCSDCNVGGFRLLRLRLPRYALHRKKCERQT